MLKRALCLMLTLAMMTCGITVIASDSPISNVFIASPAEVGRNLEVTYDLADGVKESAVTVKWYIASPGDSDYYDTGVTGKNFLVEYAHAGMNIKAKVSVGEVSVWSNVVTESLTSLVSADDKYDKDIVLSASDGYTINSGTVQRNTADNVLEFVSSAAKAKATRTFPAVTGQFAFSMKLKNSASFATSVVVGGSGGVATILTLNGTKVQISVLNDAGTGATTVLAGSDYAVGEWHLLSGAFNTDSDTFSFYVDGEKIFDEKGFRTANANIANISYVYCEIPANATGNAYVDNFNVRKIHPLPVCDAPVAADVAVIGSNRIGRTLSADYTYSGDYMEYGTKYSWYVSTEQNGNYTKLVDQTNKTLVIDDSLVGLYIKAGVTPANIWGVVGQEVLSAPSMPLNITSVGLEDSFATLPTKNFTIKAGTAGTDDVSIENGSLKVVSNGTTGHKPEITYTFSKPYTASVAYVDLMLKNTANAGLCYIQGSKGAGVRINIDSAGNMKVNDTIVAAQMAADKWYKVRLVVNLCGNTTDAAIDVYVDGVKKASGLPLKAAITNFTSIFTAKTAAGTLYVDEAKIFSVDLSGGVLSNGISWKYDAATKTLTFTGAGALPDYSTVVDKADPSYFENKDWNSFIAEVENVVIGEGITAVGSNCFRSTSNLKTVTLPASCESINAYAFIRSGVETIKMPEGLKTIGDGAFAMANSLKEVTLPNSLENIHTYAFGGDLYVETISAYSNSVAESFAREKGINVVVLYLATVTGFDVDTNEATITAVDTMEDVDVVFAAYNDQGYLKEVDVAFDVTLQNGENIVPIEDFDATNGELVKVFVWNSMTEMKALAAAYTKDTVVWMIGDSIMADWPDSRYPQEGWGETFKNYTAENVTVNNRAISGYTTENFYENVWSTNNRDNTKAPLRDEVSAGDYVIVSFIHNDYCTVANSELDTYQSTEYINVYRSYIEKFAEDCEEIGAKLVLIVPPNKGVTYNLHAMPINGVDVGDYSAVIPAVALEKGVPCIDIHKWTIEETDKDVAFLDTIYLTANYINSLIDSGDLTAEEVANHSNSGIKNNGHDTTHLSILGCDNIAQFVAESIKAQGIAIQEILK